MMLKLVTNYFIIFLKEIPAPKNGFIDLKDDLPGLGLHLLININQTLKL